MSPNTSNNWAHIMSPNTSNNWAQIRKKTFELWLKNVSIPNPKTRVLGSQHPQFITSWPNIWTIQPNLCPQTHLIIGPKLCPQTRLIIEPKLERKLHFDFIVRVKVLVIELLSFWTTKTAHSLRWLLAQEMNISRTITCHSSACVHCTQSCEAISKFLLMERLLHKLRGIKKRSTSTYTEQYNTYFST